MAKLKPCPPPKELFEYCAWFEKALSDKDDGASIDHLRVGLHNALLFVVKAERHRLFEVTDHMTRYLNHNGHLIVDWIWRDIRLLILGEPLIEAFPSQSDRRLEIVWNRRSAVEEKTK